MPEPTFIQRLLREKALSRYLTALERGDIDTIIATLRQSSDDAVLEQMIFELHETYQTEEEFLAVVQEEQEMDFKEGIHKSIPQEELDELQAAENAPTPQPSRYARWFQLVAAIVLVACLSGGVLLYTRLHGIGAQTAGSQYRWCTSSGAPLGATSIPQFSSIAAIAPDDVWVVGQVALPAENASLIEHWNGKTWSVVHDAVPADQNGYLNGMDALSANDIWTVGESWYYKNPAIHSTGVQNPLIERWNGQQWQMMPDPGGPGIPASAWLNSVSLSSDNNVWAIGGAPDPTNANNSMQNLIVHWDGSQWRTPQLPSALQNVILTSVKALAPDNVWVAGTTGQMVQGKPQGKPLVAHWDGQNWSVTPLPSSIGNDPGILNDLTATSTQDVWAAGSSSNGQKTASILLHWNGSQWMQMTMIPVAANKNIYLGGIRATGASSLWVVGRMYGNGPSQMLVAHWNGQSWSMELEQTAGDKSLFGITASGGKVWVIGGSYESNTLVNPFIETNC